MINSQPNTQPRKTEATCIMYIPHLKKSGRLETEQLSIHKHLNPNSSTRNEKHIKCRVHKKIFRDSCFVAGCSIEPNSTDMLHSSFVNYACIYYLRQVAKY